MKENRTGRFIINYRRFILFVALVMLVGSGLLYLTYQGVKGEMIESLNDRQMIHAKQAAKGIESFFHDHTEVLQKLAKNAHIIDLDATGRRMMREIYSFQTNTISVITRIDKQGRILYAEPHNPQVIGKTIVSLVSFQEALRTGRVSVSDVFANLDGRKMIAVHLPVFKEGAFNGTIALLFPFDLIAKRYVEDIRLGRDGYAWIISRDGIELSCPVPGHVGNAVIDNCRDFPDILAVAKRMMRGEQGVMTYRFDRIRGDAVRQTTKQAVFTPVHLANTFWSIVVATPEDEVTAALDGFRNKLLLIILLLMVAMGAFFYILFKNRILVAEIGRRQMAEEALRESESSLKSIFQAAPIGIGTLSNRIIKQVNDRLCEMTGYSRGELLDGSPRMLYATDEDFEFVARERYARVSEWGTGMVETRWVRKYGATIDILLSSTPLDQPGLDAGITFTALDITERKKMEEDLRQSERRYRDLFAYAVEGIYQRLPEGRFIDVNPSMAHICGYDSPEGMMAAITDVSDQYYLSPTAPETFKSLLHANGRVDGFEYRARRGDGSIIWISDSARIVRNDRGEALYYEGRIQDVTARKRAEDSLRESEEKYRLIAENSTDVIWTMDLKRRFTYLSPSITELTGYTLEEAMAIPFDRHLYEKDLPWVKEMLYRELHKSKGERSERQLAEARQYRKDGSVINIEISFAWLYDQRGETIGMQGSTRDISARKQAEAGQKKLEAQLQQARKMEAIGTLAGGIAHDFNNLLMGIQGYTSLMLVELDEGHPHYEKLCAIEKQVQSGADLTRQLLGFARGGRYEVKPTNLNELIARAAAMFGRTKKEIRMHEKYCAGIWTVDADRGQMDQILLNLFVNAWQAMPGGGDLLLETENVNLDTAYVAPYEIEPGPYVKVSITDTGVGMDEKTQQRIFDPFFTTREMGRGAGLGLASTYGIIKGHGGFIDVYSEKGRGTTFNIYLPASNREVVREEPSAGAIRKGHETILAVDDERMILDVMQGMLEGLGYRALIAQSGDEAMEIYRADHGKIDLVILDMIMPGMGGGELLDRMKAVNADVKVILSSGYSISGETKAIMARGAKVFLQKPFRLDDLSQKIREALEK